MGKDKELRMCNGVPRIIKDKGPFTLERTESRLSGLSVCPYGLETVFELICSNPDPLFNLT